MVGFIAFPITLVTTAVLLYLTATPSYQERIGEPLPPTATIIHEQGMYGFDSYYFGMINFEDDQARNQAIRQWNLLPGNTELMDSSHYPRTWDIPRIRSIMQSGEHYSNHQENTQRRRQLWVDRENNLLYIHDQGL